MVSRRAASSSDPERSRWWRFGYPALLGLLALAVPLLVWLGVNTILSSTEGTMVRTVDDPGEEGYEALVEPTPTLLVLALDDAGGLDAATLLALTAPEVGGAIVIPPAVALEHEQPAATLAETWATGGEDAARGGVEALLNVQINEARVVSPDEWASLVAPVGPLTIENQDLLEVGIDEGPIEVAAEDVRAYLQARTGPEESDLNRMVRHQQFWDAWFDAVGEQLDDPGVLPGESDVGLGLFVRELASSSVELRSLPVHGIEAPGGEVAAFEPEHDEIARMVARLVPFPLGAPPGARLRVRVLDGTGELDNGLPAVPGLVIGGAEISTVGNASSFDHEMTELLFADPELTERVQRLRDGLGVGELVSDVEPSEAIDVTVILGDDAIVGSGSGSGRQLEVPDGD